MEVVKKRGYTIGTALVQLWATWIYFSKASNSPEHKGRFSTQTSQLGTSNISTLAEPVGKDFIIKLGDTPHVVAGTLNKILRYNVKVGVSKWLHDNIFLQVTLYMEAW
jgi:hypothetical protein